MTLPLNHLQRWSGNKYYTQIKNPSPKQMFRGRIFHAISTIQKLNSETSFIQKGLH
jgi:hypothetical protein